MMHDFLEDNNVCGQNLLRIVSQGNAIIAEIHHLSDMIPNVFRLDANNSNSNRQNLLNNNFNDLVMDFNYFKSSDVIEKRIENDEKLLLKDEEFRETYLDLLIKFYLLFESIHRYAMDLERYLTELDDGIYIQQTIETVLMDHDGKQLLCEALYLMGVILLTMDHEINGIIRERLLVSYYRYSASRTTCDSRIDDVCNLMRSTGYSSKAKRPTNYPEDFFKRTKIRTSFARLIIGRLRTDDIYNLSSVYPKPEHRSVGLSTQASMLFVCLYFVPEILSSEFAIMREIVDKFFSDNFVISIYMGTIINLIEHWDPYKAAKAALNNTIDIKNIRILSQRFRNDIENLNKKIPQLLKEGIITEETILNKINEFMNTSRMANVTLRWIMLHSATLHGDFIETHYSMKRCRQIREQIINELKFNSIDLFHLLLNTSEFELRIRDIYKQILQNRLEKMFKYIDESSSRINELAEVFSGQKPLSRIEPNENLKDWFENFSKKINDIRLEINDDNIDDKKKSNKITRKLIQLIKALEEMQELGQLESNLQVKQHLNETHNYLCLIIKTISIRDEILITQQIIADLSYAWRIIDDCFTKFMQEGIKNDPTLVSKLRAAFLKLASALDLPLLRINQISSSDLLMVSQFYSSELVSYVRKVLHIIPETMFTLMANIIDIQTNRLRELPTRLMKDQLKNYAQLDERYEIARLTHSISVFTEGILAMKTTLVGVIQIDPKKLLEDGIRRELVLQVASAFHRTIVFNSKSKNIDINSKLIELKKIMDGFRRTFEYIQDYVCINGLKMWQEELSRIINYNVEQECNAFMKQKVLDYQSLYQSRSVPIPKYLPLDEYSSNFIGRIVRELTRITDYQTTIYVYGISSWHDYRTRSEIVDSKLFSLIFKNFGVSGTNGLDRLISFQIVSKLNEIFKMIDINFTRSKSTAECFAIINNYLNNETPNGIITSKCFVAYYLPMMNRLSKILTTLSQSIGNIGQLQILRQNLIYELRMSSKFHARQLSTALDVLNNSLINDFQKQTNNIIHNESLEATEKLSSIFKDESQLLFELSNYLEYNGHSEPLLKIYTKNILPPNFETILLFIIISIMPKLIYIKDINQLISTSSSQKNNESIDGLPFIFGIITLLRQFHNELSIKFFRLCSQFINACIEAAYSPNQQKQDIPIEALNMLQFLHHCCIFGGYKRKLITQYLPDAIFDQFHCLGLYLFAK